MSLSRYRWSFLALCCLPILVASQVSPPSEPNAEQVFKNIEAFKGVPAKDLIPSMEFMAASLKVECTRCHVENDFAAPTEGKQTARRMIAMQRDINSRFFNGRLQVTCMTCHNGAEHPASTPAPAAVVLRHRRWTGDTKPDAILERGRQKGIDVKLTGVQTAPFGPGKGKDEPIELTQASDGRFAFSSPTTKFGFDGKQVWRDGAVLADEEAAIFGRIGRAWRGSEAFAGLVDPRVVGKETLGKEATTVVRGTRQGTGSTEELYFSDKSGLLVRFVNLTHSSLGNVVSVYDYQNYRTVGGIKVPMTVAITFAGGEQWILKAKKADVESKVDPAVFDLKPTK